jgi:hypothetical protein
MLESLYALVDLFAHDKDENIVKAVNKAKFAISIAEGKRL